MKIIKRSKNKGIISVCVEQPPQKRTIAFAKEKVHRIFPFVIFDVQYLNHLLFKEFFSLRVFLANESANDNTPVVVPNSLGGVGHHMVCMPIFQSKYFLESSLVKTAIDVFWNSAFTNFSPYCLNEIGQEKWIQLTQKSEIPKLHRFSFPLGTRNDFH